MKIGLNWIPCLFGILFLIGCSGKPQNPWHLHFGKVIDERSINVTACPMTREYVAVMEYFKSNAKNPLTLDNKNKIAKKASSGCKNSASRFTRVDTLLRTAGFTYENSIHEALQFANKTDQETKIFVAVFKHNFATDGLNLTVMDSFRMAIKLSQKISFPKEAQFYNMRVQFGKEVISDYKKIVRFCLKEPRKDGLGLPSSQCARLGNQVAILGGNRAEEWIKTYSYATSNEGPNLLMSDAVLAANEAVIEGKGGYKNFKFAYEYALENEGMNFDRGQAVKFALSMTKSGAFPKSRNTASKNSQK